MYIKYTIRSIIKSATVTSQNNLRIKKILKETV